MNSLILQPIFAFVLTVPNQSVTWAMDRDEKQTPEGLSQRAHGPQKRPANGQIIPNDLLFEFANPESLKPYPNNPHKHPKQQIEQIRASIRAYGLARAVVVDEKSVIIDGEAVYQAAKLEGRTSVPVLRLLGLSETQKRELRIGLNAHPHNADWNVEQLRTEIEGILAVHIDLDPGDIGMSVGEIDKLLIAGAADPADDTIPEVAARAVSRSGDIWDAHGHRVGCGDCRDLSFLQRVVGERPVDCSVTDPPGTHVGAGEPATGRGRVRHPGLLIASGEMSDEAFEEFLESALGGFVKVSRDGAVHYVFMDHHHLDTLLAVGKRVYAKRINICARHKLTAGLGSLFRNKCEFICVFRVGNAPHSVNAFGGCQRRGVELHPAAKPTTKPVGLVADAIMEVTRRGDLVLDGFLGSGTCLLACERTGRLCRGVEISPRFIDLALQRWSERTGLDAVLESTGQSFPQVRAERLSGEPSNV